MIEKINLIKQIFLYWKYRIFKQRIPFAVSWALTYRCNLTCKYCSYWKQKSEELSTKDIISTIDEMKKARVQWISFTGGEPLLRDDIGKIIDYARSCGISVNLNTNAMSICEKFEKIKNVNTVQISLDGEEGINDGLRGIGAYNATIKAISLLKKNNKRVKVFVVISKDNLNSLDFIAEISKKYNIPVAFQPATAQILGSTQRNPYAPEKIEYENMIDKIIEKKRQGFYIVNSFQGLRHLRSYPQNKKINCKAGLFNCDIEPDGTMLACDRYPLSQKKVQIFKEGFIKGFNKLEPLSCQQCWCASMVEFQYIVSLNLNSIYNYFKTR